MARPFLDTNILLRHLTQDNPNLGPRASAYLARIENGEIEVVTADTVVFETVFALQRTYKVPRERIRALVLPLIELSGIVLAGKRRLRQVFDLFVDRNISFADAYHVVLMQDLGLDEIVSFDRHYDRIGAIRRIEP
jgi:predicted nucleic acid-binding protein